jgi:hypothetical protein
LEALQTLLGISKSKPSSTKIFNIALGCKDPVFVSIDIEGGGNSSAEKGPVRNTILIGHHIGGDLGLLTNPRGGKFKFSLRKFPIVLVLDTQIIAQRWFGASRKLKHIIVDLQVPLRKNDLHCAGNDACFALRVLLMLASYEDVKINDHTSAIEDNQIRSIHIPSHGKSPKRESTPYQPYYH